MKKKNLCLLALGYVAGGIMASLYASKKSEDLKKELDKSENKLEVLFKNFVDTHKKFLNEKVLTDDNKKKFYEKKDELLKIVDDYKDKAEELVKELKDKGVDFVFEARKKAEELYQEKKEELKEIKEAIPSKIKQAQDSLKENFDEIKTKIEEKAKELKK